VDVVTIHDDGRFGRVGRHNTNRFGRHFAVEATCVQRRLAR
jgi:hypothetical protein